MARRDEVASQSVGGRGKTPREPLGEAGYHDVDVFGHEEGHEVCACLCLCLCLCLSIVLGKEKEER